MNFEKMVLSALLALCVVITCGDNCNVAPNPGTSGGGFPVTTTTEGVDSAGNIIGPYPEPGQYVTGGWLSDDSGAAGSVKNFALTTDDNGNGYVANGRVYSNWSTSITWNPACNGYTLQTGDVDDLDPGVGIPWLCQIPVDTEAENSSTHFVLPGAIPSTITSYGDFATTYGEPRLRVYVGGNTPGFVSSVSASSVVPGVSATFTFPTQSNGSPLAEGFYALVNTNVASGGGLVFVNPSYLAVGGITTLSSAFGVDAVDLINTTGHSDRCDQEKGPCPPYHVVSYAFPILTQYYSNQITSWISGTIPVGSEPVAVKTYGTYTNAKNPLNETTGPANAIVANSGSSSVSIASFANSSVKNIAVGSRPMALALNSAATMAYVASYGSGPWLRLTSPPRP
jgi:hypothetical protein